MFRKSVFAALLSLVAALAIAGCTEQADRMPGAALPQTTDGDQAAVAPPDTAAGDDSAAVDIGAAVSDTVAVDVGAAVTDTSAIDAGALVSDTPAIDAAVAAGDAALLGAADALTSTGALTDSMDVGAGIDAAGPGTGKLDPPSCPTLTTATGKPGWTLASAPGVTSPKPAVSVSPYAGWKTMSGATWISSNAQHGGVAGDYVFTYAFCLCDYPKAGAPPPVLTLNLRTDNASSVYVNNTLIGTTSGTSFNAAAPTTITYSGNYGGGWKPGTNTLRVVVKNDSHAAGMIATLSVTRATAGQCARCLLDSASGQAGWTVSGGPKNLAPQAPVKVTPVAGWLPVAKATWVSTNATHGDGAGVYNYEVTLCLCDPPVAGVATASLTLAFRSDNDAKVFLNGTQIATAGNANFKAAAPATVTHNGPWQAGTNKLRIEVTNSGSYTGLAAALSGVGLRLGPCPATKLYATSQGSILRFALDGAVPAAPTVLTNEPTSQNYGVTFGPDGQLYTTNFAQNTVLRYHAGTGAPMPAQGSAGAVFVPAQSGGLVTPNGLAFDPSGKHAYVSSIGTTSSVLRYLPGTGKFVNSFTGTAKVFARGVTFGPNGFLYVTSDKDVLRYDAAGKALGVFVTDPATPPTHYDLAFGPDGNLFVTANGTNSVLRYGPTGAKLPAAGQPAGSATFVTPGLGGLDRPMGVAFGPDGLLYVASAGSNQILRYDAATGAFKDVFAANVPGPKYMVFGP